VKHSTAQAPALNLLSPTPGWWTRLGCTGSIRRGCTASAQQFPPGICTRSSGRVAVLLPPCKRRNRSWQHDSSAGSHGCREHPPPRALGHPPTVW